MNEPAAKYKNHRFPIEIVTHAICLYHRFGLSLREVEEMLLERGIVVSYETIRRWAKRHNSPASRNGRVEGGCRSNTLTPLSNPPRVRTSR